MSLDDHTTHYVIESRPHFEDLRQVAAQLAGLMVLSASGGRSATPDHPMLLSAEGTFEEARQSLLRARPSSRARRHHRHVLDAADALGRALSEARAGAATSEMDRILVPLSAGYAHLQRAARALPGFELVEFGRGCCAVHGLQDVRVASGGRVGSAPQRSRS